MGLIKLFLLVIAPKRLQVLIIDDKLVPRWGDKVYAIDSYGLTLLAMDVNACCRENIRYLFQETITNERTEEVFTCYPWDGILLSAARMKKYNEAKTLREAVINSLRVEHPDIDTVLETEEPTTMAEAFEKAGYSTPAAAKAAKAA